MKIVQCNFCDARSDLQTERNFIARDDGKLGCICSVCVAAAVKILTAAKAGEIEYQSWRQKESLPGEGA